MRRLPILLAKVIEFTFDSKFSYFTLTDGKDSVRASIKYDAITDYFSLMKIGTILLIENVWFYCFHFKIHSFLPYF